jgi:hypothetical protein
MEAAVPTNDPTNELSASRAGSRSAVTRDVLRLLLKGSALLAGSVAFAIAFVLFVPDGNDYALVTVKKHERLAALGPGKVVFVGGSNLAYGLDSGMVERALGRPVVNMGMNGYLGVRFMLEEVKPKLAPTDIVVIALEYDSYYKSADGTSSDLLAVTKANPQAFSYLSWKQRSGLAEAVPYVAQLKFLRLLREAGHGMQSLLRGAEREDPLALILSIESLAGFNPYGDLESHLGVKWPGEREDGVNASTTPVDAGVVEALREFARTEGARGVQVMLSYTPADRSYYGKHRASIDALHARLQAASPLVVPSPPSTFVFANDWFFDTVYHLNERGRPVRTKLVIDDIERQLGRATGTRIDSSSHTGEKQHD